jgi:hypothetical protein
MSGWFKLQRGFEKHVAFKAEPFCERMAWVWLISHAAYGTTIHQDIKSTIVLERGELAISLRNCASVWGWSKSKVERYLKALSAHGMLEDTGKSIGGRSKRIILISQYSKYQSEQWDTNRDTSSPCSQTVAAESRDTNRDANPDFGTQNGTQVGTVKTFDDITKQPNAETQNGTQTETLLKEKKESLKNNIININTVKLADGRELTPIMLINEIKLIYPSRRFDAQAALQVLLKDHLFLKADEILASIKAWNLSSQWQMGKAWKLSNFLLDGHWKKQPQSNKPQQSTPHSSSSSFLSELSSMEGESV